VFVPEAFRIRVAVYLKEGRSMACCRTKKTTKTAVKKVKKAKKA
jgi:hypothetical protein